jgi:hypothetical protein
MSQQADQIETATTSAWEPSADVSRIAGRVYALADPIYWLEEEERRMSSGKTSSTPSNQGEAVRKALDGARSIDIDRWDGFSVKEAAKQAGDAPQALPPLKPLAGLARDCGPAPKGPGPATDAATRPD